MRTYQIISADGHIEGPFDWAARIPEKYKDAAPKLAKREDGSYAWRLEYAGVAPGHRDEPAIRPS